MLQVARLAPKLLGDAAESVTTFLRSKLNDDGGFADRSGASDLYYTVFGVESLFALIKTVLGVVLIWVMARHFMPVNPMLAGWTGLVGVVFLCCFVAIRASSFHHVDRLLGADLGGLKINWIMELGGIALVGFGAYSEGRALKRALL